MKESNILTKIIVMVLVAYILVTWMNHLEAKSRINKAREIVYYEEPSMSDEALRAYGKQMKSACPDSYNEWIQRLEENGYMVKTEGFKR